MGTTGRFGNAGSTGLRSGHTWYDTDYTELYLGLTVVIGFFVSLVLFLLIFMVLSYLRKKYCIKNNNNQKRPSQQTVLDNMEQHMENTNTSSSATTTTVSDPRVKLSTIYAS